MAVVEWTGPVEADANALSGLPERPLRARDRAADWLRDLLAGGPRKSADVYSAAAAAGIPERTLMRAKADLRVASRQVHRQGSERGW